MFLCFSICGSYCFWRVLIRPHTQSVTTALRCLFLSFLSAFAIQMPLCPMAAITLQFLAAGAAPSGSTLWSSVWISLGYSSSVISLMVTSCFAAIDFCLLLDCFQAHWNLFINVACFAFQWEFIFPFAFHLALYLQSFHNVLVFFHNFVCLLIQMLENNGNCFTSVSQRSLCLQLPSARRTHKSAF